MSVQDTPGPTARKDTGVRRRQFTMLKKREGRVKDNLPSARDGFIRARNISQPGGLTRCRAMRNAADARRHRHGGDANLHGRRGPAAMVRAAAEVHAAVKGENTKGGATTPEGVSGKPSRRLPLPKKEQHPPPRMPPGLPLRRTAIFFSAGFARSSCTTLSKGRLHPRIMFVFPEGNPD